MAFLPLAGRRILSLAQQLPGPYCGLLLAELGADVVLVEQIPNGDPARMFPALFGAANRGKRSVALDLKHPAGRAAFDHLVAKADAVLEGFRPGVARRLGIDHERLVALRPGLVSCSISGYGQDGPAATLPGHDISYQARAGALVDASGTVAANSLPVADLASAMFAALGLVAALLDQSQPGSPAEGCRIDVSMTESVLSWNSIAIASALAGRSRSIDSPAREPAYGAFETADGWLTLSIAHEDHFWRSLCDALGQSELGGMRGDERRSRADELRPWIESTMRLKPSEEWLQILEPAGVPVGRVNTPIGTLDDPLFVARDAFLRDGDRVEVRLPLRTAHGPAVVGGPPPAVGADTRAALLEAGWSDRDVDDLVACGAAMDAS